MRSSRWVIVIGGHSIAEAGVIGEEDGSLSGQSVGKGEYFEKFEMGECHGWSFNGHSIVEGWELQVNLRWVRVISGHSRVIRLLMNAKYK